MPVAVDRTRAMTASVVHASPLKPTQDAPASDAQTPNPRKRKKAKGKEVEEVEGRYSAKQGSDGRGLYEVRPTAFQ